MQEVAADQAIMQLMDARGTLMELKVTLLYKPADMHAHTIAVCARAIGNPNVSYDQEETSTEFKPLQKSPSVPVSGADVPCCFVV